MKWDKPKRVTPPVVWPDLSGADSFVPSKNDPAFSDFNLPLLDQEVVSDPRRAALTDPRAKREGETICLRGWDL
jgi:hypothetical protein